MAFVSEAAVEAALLNQFVALGYAHQRDEFIGPDGKQPERDSYTDVLLKPRLQAAIARLNPDIPAEAQQDALRMLTQVGFPTLLEENRRVHSLLTEGVDVEFYGDDGILTTKKIRLLDFAHPEHNDWLVVNQFVVIGTQGGIRTTRRPDVVVFVNGLPLAVIELKAPGGSATLGSAYNQLQTYKQQIPALFYPNGFLVIADGLHARIGSLSADQERFMPWRTTDGTTVLAKGAPELDTLIAGVFAPQRLLELLADFVVFGETAGGLVKIIAGYHQFHAVKHAVASTLRASAPTFAEDPALYSLPSVKSQALGDKRAGVIWHTQGSGKSLLMAFYAGQLVKHPQMHNPTLVILTDRNDLDDQLFATFVMCQDLIRQTPIQAESGEDLQHILNRASGGVIFTTIQKFAPEWGASTYPQLTDRRNVVVIADEAHRSQYGLRAKVEARTGVISYGFAKYLRDALPNASFIGFTGTPIEATDINTPAIFGHYIDVYDISRAVEDGATVPIYYESRLARIELNEAEKPTLDAEIAALTEDDPELEQERLKSKWARVEALVGSDKRVRLVAEDLVRHFEDRVAALTGKALIVAMSRRICVAFYDAIVALRPHWHTDDVTAGVIKIVMTGSASDPPEWQQHIGNKARRDLLAKRLRDPNDPLQLVIVRDMWLTGFDAPCLHTMYIDKPMQGHGLMQAIARVNRVFRDKPAGLIVDYIGIAHNLKAALQQYSQPDQAQTGIDTAQAIAALTECYEVVQAMFHGFAYQHALAGTAQERLAVMAGAIEWIVALQQRLALEAATSEEQKRAQRRYQDAVLALSKAYALVSSSDEARAIREAVGFFQAIREALVKSEAPDGGTALERDRAVQQIVSRAVVSTEIVDILRAAGVTTPDLSILSDEFLEEVRQLDKQHLAFEALRKLLNDSIRSRSSSNIVQSKAFSERLQAAIARYHANALTTAEILQELIALAKDIRAAQRRGEEQGLSLEELAFYDALAQNQSARDLMGDATLKRIAHEVLTNLRENASVDWALRDSARARMRVLVKRILRKYGYPPDLQESAVQIVLQQAEALSESWAVHKPNRPLR
jgi:type I restriction enzyme, R subunit